ncbi:hypothetical protein GBAR_LOCUS30632 [Geodia barretti]|uniref:Uncharacterized protein n=1 Tax=Geodia barretti TaxID=519541 RepID=A0AA35TYJ6_GEOBA|nr:hypothetical protein GBAR_LOCUS30632 [Geodia barretti]
MWCPRRQSVPPGEQTSVDIHFHHTENRDPILELRPTHIRPRPQCSQAPPLSFRIHPFPLDGHQPLPITLRPLLCSHLQVWLENRGPIRIQPRTEAARVCLHPRTRSNSSGVSRAFPRRQHVSGSSLPGARSFPRLPLSRGSNSNYTQIKTRQLSPELLSNLTPSSSSLSSLPRSNFSLPSSVLPLSSPSTPSLFTSKATSLFPPLPPHLDKTTAPVSSSEFNRYKSSHSSTTLNPFLTRLGSKTIPHYAVAGNSSTQPISTNSTNFSRAACSQANFSRANPQNFSCASSSTPPFFGSSAAITRERLFLPMNSFIPSFSSFSSSNQSPNFSDNSAPKNNWKNQFGSEEGGTREYSNDHTTGYKQERSNRLTPNVAQHTFTHNLGGPLDFTRNSQTPSFPVIPSISRMPPTKHPRPHSLLASARDIGGTKKRCASFGNSTQNLLPHCKPSRSRSQSTSSFSVFRTGALTPDSFSLPPSFSAQDKIIGRGMGLSSLRVWTRSFRSYRRS